MTARRVMLYSLGMILLSPAGMIAPVLVQG
jgi:hypothetical protein